ncbi:glycerol-3-phosphate dehydrogenase/oxidase [Desertimonas flava]|uniref:glycerol-3-phosphate dehydrogenase/oxidase n=1 Tax=Desertimonas flava TaxID=2064846 RepID=UPI000E354D8B|nr:glycerol-3-phosphate dehydrogenase/oxidase [Desertimonas flava]
MPETRAGLFETLRRDGGFDVVVVGGGINGIGVFRDLALQGLRVLLVERQDFCSGCSAAPSRMIHGGLRYLENGEFDLVRESLRERDALLRNAPHLVHPLATTIPITSVWSGLLNGVGNFLGRASRPADRGAVTVKVGLSIYDWVSRKHRALPKHRFLGARETFRRWPELNPQVRFSAVYHDAWISHPERLGLELILDTHRLADRAVALNYAEISPDGSGFVVTDRETGNRYPLTTRAVVNATGAWVDDSLAGLVDRVEAPERLVSGTKGSHLVIDSRQLHDALDGHMLYFGNSDGRVCIVFGYLGKVLAGSTDIKVDRAERVRCDADECAYILESLRLIYPAIEVSADHVVFSYSGIRPLPTSDHHLPGRITRGHFVRRIDAAVPHFCMVGGKWTTFRSFAEHTADEVLAELGRPRTTGTMDLAIGGGKGYAGAALMESELVRSFGVTAQRAAYLVGVYGTRAAEVMAFCGARPDDQPLGDGIELTAAEVGFLARSELTVRLDDLILRRTSLAITGTVDTGLIEAVASVAGDELGWDESRVRAEIEQLVADLERYHGVGRDTLDRRLNERNATCG